MIEALYSRATIAFVRKRPRNGVGPLQVFDAFAAVFAEGALQAQTKQLAQVTQCPYCIKGHTAGTIKQGASEQQLMAATRVTTKMRAGAYAHLDARQQHAHAGAGR